MRLLGPRTRAEHSYEHFMQLHTLLWSVASPCDVPSRGNICDILAMKQHAALCNKRGWYSWKYDSLEYPTVGTQLASHGFHHTQFGGGYVTGRECRHVYEICVVMFEHGRWIGFRGAQNAFPWWPVINSTQTNDATCISKPFNTQVRG